MFGIKIKGSFIDLGQRKFTVVLKSPFSWQNTDATEIQGSILLSTKMPLTQRNIKILGKPQLLTNPLFFLKNEEAEIWAEGSVAFVGKAEVTEAYEKEVLLSVHINNLAHLKNLLLKNVNLGVIEGNTREKCMESIYFADMHPFACPTIWAPKQWGDEAIIFQNSGWQNRIGESDNRNGIFEKDFILSSKGETYAPFPKVAHLLKKIFADANFKIDNYFETDNELKQLIMHYCNPMKEREQNSASGRYNEIDLKRHVPQKLKATDFIKHYTRFFNMGVSVDNFENRVAFIDAEKALQNDAETLDWTKKVKKKYTIRETVSPISRIITPTQRDYTSKYDTFDYFPTNEQYDAIVDEDARLFKARDNEVYYQKQLIRLSVYEAEGTPISPEYVRAEQTHVLENIVSTGLLSNEDSKDYEIKVNTFPTTRINVGYTHPYFNCPITDDKNAIGGADEEKINLLLYRGFDWKTPIASAEAYQIYEQMLGEMPIGSALPQKIGNVTATNDFRTDAQHSLALSGEKGIFNKRFKKWVGFLQQRREVEFDFNLFARDLRQFSFEKNIFIGNQMYIVKELTIEFSETGISNTRGILAQL